MKKSKREKRNWGNPKMTHEIRGIVIENGNSTVYKLPVYANLVLTGPNMSFEIPEVFIIQF